MTTKLEPRARKVKILATVGPASRDPEVLRRLFRAGADAFRVNLSHGEHEDHAKTIAAIRALEKEFNWPIAVLCDLQGPKLRVGTFAEGRAVIYQTLDAAEVKFTWHEFNAAHAFLRDEGLRYDPELARQALGLTVDFFRRCLA